MVNALPLEHYLSGVISGEMSGDCPAAFLESQCLVARSWVLAHTEAKHTELPIDCCNDDCCQRYHGTMDLTEAVLRAVESTRGRVLIDGDHRVVDANYAKCCGGVIESPENVWSVRKPGQRAAFDGPAESEAARFMPVTEDNLDDYLTGGWLAGTDVFCSPNVVDYHELSRYLGKVDVGGAYFRWRVRYDREDLERILHAKLFSRPEMNLSAPTRSWMPRASDTCQA